MDKSKNDRDHSPKKLNDSEDTEKNEPQDLDKTEDHEDTEATVEEETVEVLSPFYFSNKSQKSKRVSKSEEDTMEMTQDLLDSSVQKQVWQGRPLLRVSQMIGKGNYQITKVLSAQFTLRRYLAIDREFQDVWVIEIPAHPDWKPEIVTRLANVAPFNHLKEGFWEDGRALVIMQPVSGISLIGLQEKPSDQAMISLCLSMLEQVEGFLLAQINPTDFNPQAFMADVNHKLRLVEIPTDPFSQLSEDLTQVLEYVARFVRFIFQKVFNNHLPGKPKMAQGLDHLPVSVELKNWVVSSLQALENFEQRKNYPAVTNLFRSIQSVLATLKGTEQYELLFDCSSHIGSVRTCNEDSVGIFNQLLYQGNKPFRSVLLVVSDGMGGHAGGDVASQMTLQTFGIRVLEFLNAISPQDRGKFLQNNAIVSERLMEIIDETNTIVARLGNWPEFQQIRAKPGATLCFALILDRIVFFGNVGDSRGYILRNARLHRMTRDHSLIQLRIDNSEIASEAEANEEERGIIMAHIGLQNLRHKDIFVHALCDDDVVLLCSDGLSGMVNDPDIELVLNEIQDPKTLCQTLIDEANRRGGQDNISVAVARVQPLKD